MLKSKKAVTDWSKDKTPLRKVGLKREILNFEEYIGQDSTVLNFINRPISHPTVNPYNAEKAARNKFFQDRILRNSEISDYIIPSVLVGMGATDESGLEKLISENDSLVIKPTKFSLGIGVRGINKGEAEKYLGTRGKLFPESSQASFLPDELDSTTGRFKILISLISRDLDKTKPFKYEYFSEMARAGDFEFEYGLALIQPFIDSRTSESDPYSYVRAIVCNGKFIDAYKRTTKKPIDSSSKDAQLFELRPSEKNAIGKLSEKAIKVFESQSEKLGSDFERQIYGEYLKETGNPEEILERKELYIKGELIDLITNALGEIKK